ncbi:hypothetical protein [Chelativorans sp. J32]|uniref:hypothetical protein n=1 Tax=Chelativorans sp. J32 TaxID=935840 RepID=UPI0004876D67|nr:hypothetical protein [Chelativorans sp. J32]
MVTKDNLFRKKGTSAENKAATTDKAFREIIEAEARSREAKTARLRNARLEHEAQQASIAPANEKPKRSSKARGS